MVILLTSTESCLCLKAPREFPRVSLPEINIPRLNTSGWNFPQAALAGGGTTKNTNLGGVHITVNGYNARNDNELAQIVADKINEMIDQDDSVYK